MSSSKRINRGKDMAKKVEPVCKMEVDEKDAVNFCANLVKLNERDEIIINPDCSTSYPGIFAAGDVTNAYGKRIVIASGEGAKAALAVRQYILNLRKWDKGHHNKIKTVKGI